MDVDASFRGNYRGDIRQARKNGAKLIVIDPRKTPTAEGADLHLQVRPGTDCALALGMIHVIINEGLYDKEFVENWTTGFDQLKEHVKEYTPQKAAEITWIPEEKIVEAARMYARNRPAAIGIGIGGMCQSVNSFQANRAVSSLASITGNLDIPGGHINHVIPLKEKGTMVAQYDMPFGMLSVDQIGKRLNLGRVVKRDGYLNTHPEALWPAIREGKPYPVKAMLAIAANPILTAENALLVRNTLLKLDFLAVTEMFMTPTAEISDIVLPVVHWSERNEVVDSYTRSYVFCHPRIVEPPEGVWEDKKILIELAKRLGFEGYFQSVEESVNDRLKRLNMTFEEFKTKGFYQAPVKFKKHEESGGFKTRSKKVELYSESLKQIGSDPLPVFREPPESPVSSPEIAKEYPLILITGINTIGYFHSGFRNVPSLRKLVPEPYLDMHPDAARERGIQDGDWVSIETRRGVVKHKARLTTNVDPRVVAAPHGWWYGYKDGWKEVNINVLTDGDAYDPDVGSTVLKGLLCEVRKADSPPPKI